MIRIAWAMILCLAAVAACPLPVQADSPPARIVSNNMCTDQLLLALADRSRIAALSPYAGNPVLSHAADKAKGIPQVSGTSEDLLQIRPDLVLTSQFDRRTTVEFIKAKGTRVESFELVQTVDGVRDQILRLGTMLDVVPQALTLVKRIDAATGRLQIAVQKGQSQGGPQHNRGLRVLPIARRGWSAGRETLIGDILRLAGLSDARKGSGAMQGGFLSLEAIIDLKPDLILLSADSAETRDNGTAMLLHPALTQMFPPERRIILPDRLTVCGGPMVIEAMDSLAAALANLTTAPR